MKHILLTGLDGSGKSFLIDRLEKICKHQPVSFLRVPKIDEALFIKQKRLYNTAIFINEMHKQADVLKLPQLKSVALFSAMLVFKELMEELKSNETKLLFSERHPLIDTGVYARFYIGKMNPATVDFSLLGSIEKKYASEIIFLLRCTGKTNYTDKPLYELLQFIHEWFSVNKKYSIQDLKELFKVDMPDHIIYLSADPEILMQRLMSRHILEPHETTEVFKKLIPAYEDVLQQSKVSITSIDASNFRNLDQAFENIVEQYHLNNDQ